MLRKGVLGRQLLGKDGREGSDGCRGKDGDGLLLSRRLTWSRIAPILHPIWTHPWPSMSMVPDVVRTSCPALFNH